MPRNKITHNSRRNLQLRSRESDKELSINSVNLLIEKKVDEGVKEIRKKIVPYFIAVVVSVGFGMWGCYKGIVNDIKERLTSAYVADSLNKHIVKFTDEKVSCVADGRISIAEKRIIAGFEKKVSAQESMLEESSAKAETQIQSLRAALEVMKKAYDARGGNRRAFDEIALLSTNATEVGEIASKVIREIEASYSARKGKERLGFMENMHQSLSYKENSGKRGPISFADATLLILSHNGNFEEGAIYRLAESNQKEFVEILMLAADETSNLNTVYVALRSIEKLTGVSFPVLGVAEAKKWWEQNEEKPEYHSPYKNVWAILLNGQLQIQPKESTSDYYKRAVIPLYDAIIAKPDLEGVAKDILPIAFRYGLELRGEMEGVDCLKIIKDLISHLGEDADARKTAFCYTINTMALYEKRTTAELLKFIVHAIKARPDYLQLFKEQKMFTPEFKELVESAVKTLEEHTKGVSWHSSLSQQLNGDTVFLGAISIDGETLHNLKLTCKKTSKQIVVNSSSDLAIAPGEVEGIDFKTDRRKGRIFLLNDDGVPILFDLQFDGKTPAK